jgi:hypothetical protein
VIEGPQLATAVEKPGYIKVRLFYHTWEPQHSRSQALIAEFAADPPFVEDVSVLLPVAATYDRLSAFEDIFRLLQHQGVVSSMDKLHQFEFRDEDVRTLAYYEVTD